MVGGRDGVFETINSWGNPANSGSYPGASPDVKPTWRQVGTGMPHAPVSSLVYAVFAVFSFRDLIVVNVWLHSLSLLVELAAFLQLRVRAPAMARPWRVPGGWVGAGLAVGVPSAFALLAMATAGWRNVAAGVVAALTGPAVYAMVSRRAVR